MVHTSTNPYVTDRPVGRGIPFYGRVSEFDWVKQSCLRGERILILHGPMHIGKTSFLYQLPEVLPEEFAVVWIDLDTELVSRENTAVRHFVQVLARRLSEAGIIPEGVDWAGRTDGALSAMLAEVDESLGERHLILALDSVESLFETEETEADLWQLVEQFQGALNRCERVHVLWSGDGADRLQGSRFPRFERASIRRLGSLSMNAATSLVIEPVRDVVSYEPPAVRRIIELASGHPYYIQLICQAIYNAVSESSWTVSLRDVENTVDTLLAEHVGEFETIWESSTTSEKIVLTALGTIRGNHGVSTRQEVGNALRRANINVTQEEVTDNLECLVARGVLERLGAMTYRFRVDLMRSWLRHRKNISDTASLLGSEQRSEDVAVRTARNILIGGIGLAFVVVAVAAMWWFTYRGRQVPNAPADSPVGATIVATVNTPTPFSGPTPTSTPHPTPTRPRIRMRSLPAITYFAREDRNSPWQVWVMGSDGKDPQRITDTESDETSPVWSPDGSKFVFVSQRDGNRELYVMDANGANLTRLTKHPADDWMAVWSPDGKEIAFVSRRYGNWEIFTIKPDGTDLQRLTEMPEANNWTPAYSPDGQEMVFASNRDGDWELYVMNRDGTMPLRLTEVPGNDFSPAWSPRGDKIIFESTRDGNAEIYMMNRDGSEQVNLSRAPLADDHWPCWSPDGSHIAFQSNRDGDWDIYTITAEGTSLTNLTRNRPGSKQGPHWRP